MSEQSKILAMRRGLTKTVNIFAIYMHADMFAGFSACAKRLRTNFLRGTKLESDNGEAPACFIPTSMAGRLRKEDSREDKYAYTCADLVGDSPE